MRIISLDPGTATTGFAILDVENKTTSPILHEASTFLTPSDMDPHNRL